MRTHSLRQQHRAIITFPEESAFRELKPHYLRKIPRTVYQAIHHAPVAKIRGLSTISIRSSDKFHRISHVFHVLSANIHHGQIVLVITARIFLHVPALPLHEQHKNHQCYGHD